MARSGLPNIKGLGKVGYVANSSYSVLGECMSAGRMYDKMRGTATENVKYILPQGIVCKLPKGKSNNSDLQMPGANQEDENEKSV